MTHPVPVLLHGYLGFSHYGPIRYFRGVELALRQVKTPCLSPSAPPAGSIAERAESLAQQLLQSDIPSFALMAHSMGGLDARYLIANLDPDHRVKRLITVGTPHHGTPVATWFLESPRLFPALIRRIGQPALSELVPETRLAVPIPDREDVVYFSYAGARSLNEMPCWLRPFSRMIPADNDGLVPVESAKWGNFRGTLRADHFELIGWSLGLPNAKTARPFKYIDFWLQAATVGNNL